MDKTNNSWEYYNHALIPTCAPNEVVGDEAIEEAKKKLKGKTFFARWTSDYDIGHETEWWYCVKDTAFDKSGLKAKRRYEITKGERFFEVKVINAKDYINEMAEVQYKSFQTYSSNNRNKKSIKELAEGLKKEVEGSENNYIAIYFGAFDRESGKLCGYAFCKEYDSYCVFSVMKCDPDEEKRGINAAVVNGIVEYFNPKLTQGDFFIVDGERNIVHETAFQDFLIKYFEFRKAYCKLHIEYSKSMRLIVNLCYAFKGIFKCLDKNWFFHRVNAIIKMEEIIRNQ